MLEAIKGITDRRLKYLIQMGIHDIYGLLSVSPRKYMDMDNQQPLNSFLDGELAICKVRISGEPKVRYIRKNMSITEMQVTDGAYTIGCFWFNQPYVSKKDIAKEYFLIGKITSFNGKRQFSNPVLEPVDGAMTGLVPIYSLPKGFRQKEFRTIIGNAISYARDNDALLNLPGCKMDIIDAFEQLHFPTDNANRFMALERLKYDEAVYLTCAFDLTTTKSRALPVRGDLYSLAEFESQLPFKLTEGQKRAMAEVSQDMDDIDPMNRLLQGNVGCGKTVVAVFALFANYKNGYQSAFMSPTEVLAIQNFNSTKKYLPDCRVALLVGSTPKKEKSEILTALKSGDIDIIVGTHSLIQDGVDFSSLNLVITDEQHRFGVKQRAKLSSLGGHTLIMSATPIPRTLALIAFDKLQLSVIKEMPKGRLPVSSHIIFPDKRDGMYQFVNEQCKEGKQAYVVCPLIDPSEAMSAKSAKEIYSELQKEKLKNLRIGLLHGRMKAADKDAILQEFRKGNLDVLVSTTVIEVGVDVKNATVMVIENSDRFGLAALHQLRGRVGRGESQSYCFACLDNEASIERLKIFKNNNDGLEISRLDLSQRGMGEFIGVNQHGGNILRFIDLGEDEKILEKAKITLAKADRELQNDIKKQTLRFYDSILEDIILN